MYVLLFLDAHAMLFCSGTEITHHKQYKLTNFQIKKKNLLFLSLILVNFYLHINSGYCIRRGLYTAVSGLSLSK